MDRRATPANGRVAHVSLRGRVAAKRFTEGETRRVCRTVAPIHDSPPPGGWRRDRELVLHEGFRVLEEGEGWVFGFAERDGYTGYMRADSLRRWDEVPTHRIAVRQSYIACAPVLKNSDEMTPISYGTLLTPGATFENGRWAEVAVLHAEPHDIKATWTGFVPTAHLRPIDRPETDPVAVAERFLGTPYHWGGNSGFGIDCSGLVQAALLACAIPCPGDSDQQQAQLGKALPPGTPPQRGDLLFWKGHVGFVRDPGTLLHANAHHMAVALEPLDAAIARIRDQGDGEVTAHKRI